MNSSIANHAMACARAGGQAVRPNDQGGARGAPAGGGAAMRAKVGGGGAARGGEDAALAQTLRDLLEQLRALLDRLDSGPGQQDGPAGSQFGRERSSCGCGSDDLMTRVGRMMDGVAGAVGGEGGGGTMDRVASMFGRHGEGMNFTPVAMDQGADAGEAPCGETEAEPAEPPSLLDSLGPSAGPFEAAPAQTLALADNALGATEISFDGEGRGRLIGPNVDLFLFGAWRDTSNGDIRVGVVSGDVGGERTIGSDVKPTDDATVTLYVRPDDQGGAAFVARLVGGFQGLVEA